MRSMSPVESAAATDPTVEPGQIPRNGYEPLCPDRARAQPTFSVIG